MYPGDVDVTVELNSSINCSTISSSGVSRCVDIVKGLTISQTNDIGSTISHTLQDCNSLNYTAKDVCLCSIVLLEQQQLHKNEKSLSVKSAAKKYCPNTKYLASVTFGGRSDGNDSDCEGLKNVLTQPLSPGDSATFSVDSFGLPSNEYCYILSLSGLNEETGEYCAIS